MTFARSLLFAGLLVGVAACSAPSEPPAEATPHARPVRIAAVEKGPALPPVIGTGVVAARDEARLSFKIGGVIRDIAVREGERVTAGQRLATLETIEVDAGVTQARAAHEKAQRDLTRGRQLFGEDVLTQEQLDDLGTAAAVAKAQFESAQFNRRYAEIVAPADGRVLRRLADPRELVAPGQPVLMVSSGSGYTLRLGLPDRHFVQVRIGDTATVRFDAWPQRSFDARVVERSGAADPRSGVFAVRLELDAGDAALASGLIGRAQIAASGGGSDAPLDYVPLSALVEGAGDETLLFLYDASGNRAQARKVRVAFLTTEAAALTAPLPPGSRVITDGAAYLHDGDAVRVVESAAN